MKLAEGERLVRTWNVYSYGRGNRKTECSFVLTNKRVISRECSKTKTMNREFPLASVRSWSVLNSHRSGTAWIVVGILLCVLLAGIPFGIPCIVHGVRLGRSGSFTLSLHTRRKSSDFMQRGVRFLSSREASPKSDLSPWQKFYKFGLICGVVFLLLIVILELLLFFVDIARIEAFLNGPVFRIINYILSPLILFCLICAMLSYNFNFWLIDFVLNLVGTGKEGKRKNGGNTSRNRRHGKTLKRIRVNYAAAEEIFDQLGALIVENQTA